MLGFKNIFASKTVLTSILGTVFALLSALGVIDVAVETQAAVVTVLFALAGLFRYNATEQLVVSGTPTSV